MEPPIEVDFRKTKLVIKKTGKNIPAAFSHVDYQCARLIIFNGKLPLWNNLSIYVLLFFIGTLAVERFR